MDNRLSKIFYSEKGYWKGSQAVTKLAEAAKVSKDDAREASFVADLFAGTEVHT